MSFIKSKYKSINIFANDYLNNINKISQSIKENELEKIVSKIIEKIKKNKNIFVCGNGGSAAIANHFVCDFLKYMKTNNKLNPKVISLSTSTELITAISNDISYNNIFSYQLDALGRKGDLLILISSSGNSKNIIKAIECSKKKNIETISFTGFYGGYAKKKTDMNLHFNFRNYGLSEDSHHIFMHIICQYIRQKFINKKSLRLIKF